MGVSRGRPTVLVVDDEPALVELYAANLDDEYDVVKAHGGREAVSQIEATDRIDVALIDRRMPAISGDEVLERIAEASPDCRVAMVTAVEPDFDVIDMPFDEYLVKPIARDDLRETVDRLLRLESYREQRQEAFALASKVAALRAHKESDELADNEEYQELTARLNELREQLDETAERFEATDFAAAFSDIRAGGPPVTTSD